MRKGNRREECSIVVELTEHEMGGYLDILRRKRNKHSFQQLIHSTRTQPSLA